MSDVVFQASIVRFLLAGIRIGPQGTQAASHFPMEYWCFDRPKNLTSFAAFLDFAR